MRGDVFLCNSELVKEEDPVFSLRKKSERVN